MQSFGATDIGKRRKMNQDYLFYSDQAVGCFSNLYIVADGMGGHRAGDKASSVAVNRFVEIAKETKKGLPFLNMDKILKQVNKEVWELSQNDAAYQGMGTTLVVATVEGNNLYVMNVGDSRLYLYDGALKQITLDHSLVEEMVRAGELSPELSRNHPQKNIITRAVGISPQVKPDYFIHSLKKNSRILLCSDGLSNMVEDSRLKEILRDSKDLKEAVESCIDDALFYGGVDNIAVVIASNMDGGCESC